METNESTLAMVRAHFRGSPEEWRPLERRMRLLLTICGTEKRYFYDQTRPVAGHAAAALADLLVHESIDPRAIHTLLYTGIAKEYFEPATAAEVAARVGAPRAAAIDVGAACAGMLVGVHDLVARMALDDAIELGVACSASISGEYLSYDIQNVDDLDVRGAGLTIGNASTAWAVGRRPFRSGGRIVGCHVESWNDHQDICRTPTVGHFTVRSQEMFALQDHVPDFLRRSAARVGWDMREVDLVVSHQPSNRSMRELADAFKVPRARFPELHQLYGNTETSSVPLSLRTLIDDRRLRPGMKVMLGSAAAGFVLASVALVWE